MPLSIFRVKGLAAADATQLVGIAGLLSMFFFLTLYMQNVLGYSAIQTGAAYLPALLRGRRLRRRLLAAPDPRRHPTGDRRRRADRGRAAIYELSRIPVHGSYVSDLLPGLLSSSLGLGAVFVGVTTAANAGVPADKAGLAAALLNSSQQLGGALGLAIFSAIATSRTNDLLAGAPPAGGAHLGLPAGAARREPLPARRRDRRAAGHQHARRGARADHGGGRFAAGEPELAAAPGRAGA